MSEFSAVCSHFMSEMAGNASCQSASHPSIVRRLSVCWRGKHARAIT